MTLTLSEVVHKYNVDNDIVMKYLKKSLLSILLQLFYHYLFIFEKLNTKYE